MNQAIITGTWLLASLLTAGTMLAAPVDDRPPPTSVSGQELFRDVNFAHGFGVGGYAPVYADDLWPHLLLWQHFGQSPRIAAFDRINLDLTVTVARQAELSDWLPSREMNLQFYFLLVDERLPEPRTLWVGMMVHSSNERNYCEHIGREQYGDVFYRDTVTNYGPPLKLNEPTKVSLDLKELIRKAIRRFDDVQADLSRDPDAYSLRDFNCGFEGLGHWESEIVLSGFSLRGYPVGADRRIGLQPVLGPVVSPDWLEAYGTCLLFGRRS